MGTADDVHRQLRAVVRGCLGGVNDNDLAVVSVLSGNRNFEGRIQPGREDELPRVAAAGCCVRAGRLDGRRSHHRAARAGLGRQDVFLADIWPTPQEVQETIDSAVSSEMFTRTTPTFSPVTSGGVAAHSESGAFAWDDESTYVRKPPYFDDMPAEPTPVEDIEGARVLAKLGDSVTTDHISPAGSIKADSPAGRYLTEHGVERRDFNSYGSRRGNHEVMIRGTFANIRLRNLLAPGIEGA